MHKTEHDAPPSRPPENARFETRDVALSTLLKWIVSLFIFMAFATFITLGLYRFLITRPNGEEAVSPIAHGPMAQPSPIVQAYPVEDIKEFRAKEDTLVNSYGWVDQKAGKVRIPLDQALDIVAARGLPVTSGKVTPQQAAPRNTSQSPGTTNQSPLQMPAGSATPPAGGKMQTPPGVGPGTGPPQPTGQ
ncbi:MAG TPA: hypothetical protein VGS41_07735 [Chthonomonadales bacterium]|nr:hypothetical protein [Chthonomonadales bacterium]